MKTPQLTNNPQHKIREMTTWVSSECNLRCKYCFVYKLNPKQPPGKMTRQTADQLIQFASQNLNPEGNIWFFGSEPFCNYDIIRYIVEESRADGHHWRFGATTNCTLITEEIAQWMKKHNFKLNCSIDGPKAFHDVNRVYPDGSGSWDHAWKGLSYIRKYINPNPQLRWTVTPSTTKGLAEGIRTLVEKHRLTTLAVDFAYEVDWTPRDLATLRRELEIFKGYYGKWMEEGTAVFSMWVRDANKAVNKTARHWLSRCGLGAGAVGVDYDGTLYPCHRFIDSHQIKIGDIYSGFNRNFLDWTRRWRASAPYCEIPRKCLKCNYKGNCIGGCIAMNFDVFGNAHVNPETTCTIKQLITEVFGDMCKALQQNSTFQKLYGKGQKSRVAPATTTPQASQIKQRKGSSKPNT